MLFLRTLDMTAYAVRDEVAANDVVGFMPFRVFNAVEDQRTCAAHRALDQTVRRHDDPFWSILTTGRLWGCRCGSTSINDRAARRRGLRLPA